MLEHYCFWGNMAVYILIPYVIYVAVVGALYYLELYLGQFTSKGTNQGLEMAHVHR
jgi:hypothetical protein